MIFASLLLQQLFEQEVNSRVALLLGKGHSSGALFSLLVTSTKDYNHKKRKKILNFYIELLWIKSGLSEKSRIKKTTFCDYK